ncbi:hypothetical protein FRC01_000389, partial [Tulasnella sp. 417]
MPLTTQQEKAPEQRGRYRLPIEALQDGKKLKSQIISMDTTFDAAYLFAEASLIPGLGSLVLMTKKIWESSEKVGAHKEAFKRIRQELSNFCYILADNQNLIDSESDIMREIHRVVGVMEADTEKFAKWGFWKIWLNRNRMAEQLEAYRSSLEQVYHHIPLAIRRDPVSGLREVKNDRIASGTFNHLTTNLQPQDIRVARSSSEIHALEEKIHDIRMDPAIDISSLPADLSREVKCTGERAIYGTQYVVKQGKWLNRDIVAMKWPKDFGPLACSASCGGTPEACFEQTRHVPAAKAME